MAETILVTGGTGFLGGALLRQLVAGGGSVRALARGAKQAAQLQELGAEPVLGDLLDQASLERAMSGVELVFHAAGLNTLCPLDPRPLFEVNVRGSSNLVAAAGRSGVRRVVYTSSAATLGEPRGEVASENTSHRGWFLSAYERSKFDAEVAVLEMARRTQVEVVVVSPSSVQGPGRTRGTGRWLIRYANGQLRWLVDTRVSLCDIADCTKAHLLAAERGRPGERYLINGSTTPIRELTQLVAEVTGRDYPLRSVPGSLAVTGAVLLEEGFRLRGRRPPVCREMVRTLLHGHAYDGSRAARELGFSYTPLATTVRQALLWYAANGYLRETSWAVSG